MGVTKQPHLERTMNAKITGLALLSVIKLRFKYTTSQAIREMLDHDQLTSAQRQQRQTQRNAYLIEDVTTIQTAIERQPDNEAGNWNKCFLNEILDECKAAGVDNFGKTLGFS